MAAGQAIRVLVVDDSAVVRQALSDILGRAPGIRVIGALPDPIFAMKQEFPGERHAARKIG